MIRDSKRANGRKQPQLIELATASAVIDTAYGGTNKAAAAFDVPPQMITNWRTRGFPPKRFHSMTQDLAQRGYRAPPALWQQQPIQSAKRSTRPNGRDGAAL